MRRKVWGGCKKVAWTILFTILVNSIFVCATPDRVYATEDPALQAEEGLVPQAETDLVPQAELDPESKSEEDDGAGGTQSQTSLSDVNLSGQGAAGNSQPEGSNEGGTADGAESEAGDGAIIVGNQQSIETNTSIANNGSNQLIFSDNLWVAGFVKDGPSLAYTGSEVKQKLQIFYGNRQLLEGRDYFLIYRNNVTPKLYNTQDAAYVQIIMMGQYRGAAKLYYSIRMPEEYADWGDEEATVMPPIIITPDTTTSVEPENTTEGDISLSTLFFKIDDMTYTGEEVRPDADNIHVYLTREDMEAGIEFTEPCYVIESYHNNIVSGRAHVVVRGIGNYYGRCLYYFSILHKTLTYKVVTDVSFDKDRIFLGVGENTAVNATVLPEDAFNTTLIWSSSDTTVAEVSSSGIIYGKSAGRARIKAVAQDTGKAAWCDVIVDDYPEGNYVTPQMFLKPDDDGNGDVTYAFNNAIKSLNTSCDTMYVPAGEYLIDADIGIQLRSNVKLVMSPRAVLQAKDNLNRGYNVIAAKNVSNVLISGGQIVGDRYSHLGSGGEWGHGIGIYDSLDVTVDSVDVADCWGDGIYLGSEHDDELPAGCDGVTISGCALHDNRRNNLSIVCADNVIVRGCRLDGANGTAPQLGMDIETNNDENPCEHILVEDCSMSDNRGGSVYITTVAADVRFVRCALNGLFVNYEGRDVVLTDCLINGEADARVGVTLENTVINDKGASEDKVIVDYDPDNWEVTLGKYNQNAQNVINGSYVTVADGEADGESKSGSVSFGGERSDVAADAGGGATGEGVSVMSVDGDGTSASVRKVIRIERPSDGTGDAGVSMSLKELSGGTMTSLRAGFTYRFEYTIRGNGLWGIKTNQTGWYPIVTTESFSTGIVTYNAGSASSCNLMIYAIDKTKDMYLEIENIRIIEVR